MTEKNEGAQTASSDRKNIESDIVELKLLDPELITLLKVWKLPIASPSLDKKVMNSYRSKI